MSHGRKTEKHLLTGERDTGLMDQEERRKIRQAWESARRAPVRIKIPEPRYDWFVEEEKARKRRWARRRRRFLITMLAPFAGVPLVIFMVWLRGH